jgi:hypothetical protein
MIRDNQHLLRSPIVQLAHQFLQTLLDLDRPEVKSVRQFLWVGEKFVQEFVQVRDGGRERQVQRGRQGFA